MRFTIIIFISFLLFSCNKKDEQYEQQISINDIEEHEEVNKSESEQNISNNIKTDTIQLSDGNLRINTIPQGAFLFLEDDSYYITPVTLNLEIGEYRFRIERLRYYPEELNIKINQIEFTDNDFQIQLRKNQTFTDDYYLSYTSEQFIGIKGEFCRYIYNDNAQLIRIDNYSYDNMFDEIVKGYYNVTLDNNGNIISRRHYHAYAGPADVIQHFEYNNENQLIRSYFTGIYDYGADVKYFYRDGVLARTEYVGYYSSGINYHIVEIEYGSIDSDFTKREYRYDVSYENKEKEIDTENLSKTIYTFQ
jgi:hypothetical protein